MALFILKDQLRNNHIWLFRHHGKWSDKKYFQNIYWE
jgi:hypothetical protein